MKIVESWLREWIDTDLDTQALAYRLTMAGHEVDGIDIEGAGLDGRLNDELDGIDGCIDFAADATLTLPS